MKIKDFDLEKFVESLNDEYINNIYSSIGEYPDEYPYSYTSNGNMFAIEFMGMNVYCSENDRDYDDNDNLILVPIVMKNVLNIIRNITIHSKSDIFSDYEWKEQLKN